MVDTLLSEAILHNDERTVLQLIQNGTRDRDLVSLFSIICRKGMIIAVRLILHKGIVNAENIDEQDFDGSTALYCACQANKFDIAKILMQYGAKHIPNRDETTPLHWAAYHGNIDVIEFMIEKKIIDKSSIDLHNRSYETPLHWACWQNKPDTAKMLIRLEAKNVRNKHGNTPFFRAAFFGMTEVIELMLEKGIVDVDNIDALHYINQTALQAACSQGRSDTAKMLIHLGAKNSRDQLGSTPLHWAACRGMIEVIQLMFEKGLINESNINAQDDCLQTPLYRACYSGERDIAKLLIKHGGVNMAEQNASTPLRAASLLGMADVIELMLEKGIVNKFNINARTDIGMTALGAAFIARHETTVVKLLIKWGADILGTEINGFQLIKTIRAYKTGALAADDTTEYLLAMMNDLMQGGDVKEHLLSNPMYNEAVQASKIKEIFANDSEGSQKIHYISQNDAIKYINKEFIPADIKNKLLLNAINWHKNNHIFDQETFDKIQHPEMLSHKYIALIKQMDMTDPNFKTLAQGVETSSHVFTTIMSYMLNWTTGKYENKIDTFNKFYNKHTSEELQNNKLLSLIDYISHISESKGKEGIEAVQCIFDNFDDDNGTIFNKAQGLYNEFACFRSRFTYSKYQQMVEIVSQLEEEAQKEAKDYLNEWHKHHKNTLTIYNNIFNLTIRSFASELEATCSTVCNNDTNITTKMTQEEWNDMGTLLGQMYKSLVCVLSIDLIP